MFDLAWSEIALVGLVAVLVLGPKELPQAMRTMAKMMRKVRGLTSELQGHMNEIVREAELDEVRQSIKKLSSTNLKAEAEKIIDPGGEMQAQLNAATEASALVDHVPPTPPAQTDTAVAEPASAAPEEPTATPAPSLLPPSGPSSSAGPP